MSLTLKVKRVPVLVFFDFRIFYIYKRAEKDIFCALQDGVKFGSRDMIF